MQFKAVRGLYGDYGPNGMPRQVQPGEVFTVPDNLVKRLEHLEARGIIQRHIRPIDRSQFRVYEAKVITPETKQDLKCPLKGGKS